jgi:acyl-CoA thioester hydrolase
MKVFQHPVVTKEADFDQLGHINNVVYLQWVQDVAEAHWLSISGQDVLSQYIWVALRHEIDYLKEIRPGEAIMAETFVQSMEGVKSERITVIKNDKNQLKAKACTFWCLLNAETKRPQRISEELKELFIE